ncbi:aspartate/glutamate racemase family protein [Aquimarina brevivitae]|uniref:Aspartate racemase n=1 Tax=Aquimarina brevivitae TaxID=323412 RepID=A0A4Q7P164_9FLAO|nr:amino acid racemase [Aquimarina brevivitae]RZS93297.1 aspartate racemase [Aquimarina brevivitae]
MKTLGLIGGTSWHATVEYYRLINTLVANEIGAQANPELLLYSLNVEVMRKGDDDEINAKYLEVSQTLQEAGAEAIVICANTPHMVYEYVQPKIKIPILHIASATGKEAANKGLKKLGLLGTKPTMQRDFISNVLATDFGIQTLLPKDLEQCHKYIADELTQGKFTAEAKEFYKQQIELLKTQGADGIILGCTELPILMKNEATVLPLLSTTDLHAQMAVDFILGN